MAANTEPGEGGFRRQVTFRIGPADAPLLEVAARANGGIQAGIVAALRAYTAERLRPAEAEVAEPEREPQDAGSGGRSAPKRKPESGHEPRQATTAAETVELNVGEAAAALGLSPSTLRERIKRGKHPGRVGSNGLWAATRKKPRHS